MFDRLVAAALTSGAAGAVGAWARVENAACARRLAAMAEELDRMIHADGSAEREQWCLDNWDAVAAAVGAAQNISLGMASHQLLIADSLRQRLPRVAQVFATGAISYRMITAVVSRTRLIKDRDALAHVDSAIAAHIQTWGSLSVDKTRTEIDYWVDRYDPAAVRRSEYTARGRHVDIRQPEDGCGIADLEARLLATDAEALDQRLEAMAAAVCKADPRTLEQRRADALGALGHGAEQLSCGCGDPDCPAADTQPSTVAVHVIAGHDSLTDDTAAQWDGQNPPGPTAAQLREMTITQALTDPQPPPNGPAKTPPAVIMGGGMLPAPLLAAKIAATATITPIVHPGDTGPQPRYTPTAVLATFIRCRDMTCRFPGCDEPAHHCDIDHTIAYPHGPTQASNLKSLCRKHHLLKTFGGWHDQQHPDGTVIWTCPQGQTYTTHPGSRLLFPTLCTPTAPAVLNDTPHTHTADNTARALAMPRRTTTRTHNRTQAINNERAHNEQALNAEAEARTQAHAREQGKDPETSCDDLYSPSRPRPPGDDDPPPF
jgi:hypothetical protein